MITNNVLTITCPDESGLIAKISSCLYKHNCNIISNGEFVERQHNRFFMRTEFSGQYQEDVLYAELKAILPEDHEISLSTNRKKNIVVLATKEYHCLGELLLKFKFNDLNANILAVVSNYNNLKTLADKFNVPYYWVDHTNKTREEHEEQIQQVLKTFSFDYIVLAKYMRILSPGFIEHYANRIINIHHSFLPAFIGANPYLQAYERGVKIIGATAHFVNENLDEGPIIAQNVITVDHTHSAREMAQAGRDVEKNVLAYSLQLVLDERVFVFRNKTIILR